MIDFTLVNQYKLAMYDFAQQFTLAQLRQMTEDSVDRFLVLLVDATDAEITFAPMDEAANDAAAADPADRQLAWHIGHNVVHATASAEEYAVVAAELARGVPFHGRPRYETPWQQITTVAQCRQRLVESRRLRLASLAMWPDQPNLTLGYTPWRESGWVNAKGVFTWGLAHDDSHYRQISKILAEVRVTYSQ